MASNTPTCFPRSTTSGPGGDPLKGPVSQPSHPRCGHWELTVQGPKTDAGTAQGDPWLPGLPLAQPTLCEGANSVAEKLRQHSISFQTNHSFFFFFFFSRGGKKHIPTTEVVYYPATLSLIYSSYVELLKTRTQYFLMTSKTWFITQHY